MHEGFRKPGDNTCSTCPREIEPEEGMPLPTERTLCSGCLRHASELANTGPVAGEALIYGSGLASGWKIGSMIP